MNKAEMRVKTNERTKKNAMLIGDALKSILSKLNK